MLPAELIKKKRDGHELSPAEIENFITNYLSGSVADYQMSAFLMAVFLNGMTKKETFALTSSMLHSGDVIKFDSPGKRVDKHSTGGVGDKTSLIIGPIVAAAGIGVPMISGRGLGHTGGTLDKFESIPGFNVFLNLSDFKKQVNELGVCFIGQTKEICPADKRMYALRDVTGTVECIPLICASIMSKKLAEGIDGLVLDVKVGSGAFMKTPKEAEKLARQLIEVGKLGKKKVIALLTDMSQPLGAAIGNSLEVEECLGIMRNRGPKDLRDLSLQLAAQMILVGGKAKNLKDALALSTEILESGKALRVFEDVVKRQGGDLSALPKARHKMEVLADKNGFIKSVDAEKIGTAAILLGAGRAKADDKIDPSSGIIVHKKIGDAIAKSESLATLYFNSSCQPDEAARLLKSAYAIHLQKPNKPRLIIKIIK